MKLADINKINRLRTAVGLDIMSGIFRTPMSFKKYSFKISNIFLGVHLADLCISFHIISRN